MTIVPPLVKEYKQVCKSPILLVCPDKFEEDAEKKTFITGHCLPSQLSGS